MKQREFGSTLRVLPASTAPSMSFTNQDGNHSLCTWSPSHSDLSLLLLANRFTKPKWRLCLTTSDANTKWRLRLREGVTNWRLHLTKKAWTEPRNTNSKKTWTETTKWRLCPHQKKTWTETTKWCLRPYERKNSWWAVWGLLAFYWASTTTSKCPYPNGKVQRGNTNIK